MLIQFLFHMIINYMNFQNMTYFFWYHLNGCVIHLINKTSTKDWRRKWQPTPVFLPGESHGRRSLVGCSPWGRTESDTTSDAATANVPRKKHTFPISIFSILSIDQWHYWWKKKNPANAGDARDTGSIPGSGRSLEEGTPTHPVFLPGGSHGQRTLWGYSPWGHTESDRAEVILHAHTRRFTWR